MSVLKRTGNRQVRRPSLSAGPCPCRALVATAPDPGTKTLIVTHKPNILDAFGKDWFEIREGEASIFKPEAGGTYTLVARVQIGQWATAMK